VKHAIDGLTQLSTTALIDAASIHPSPRVTIRKSLVTAPFNLPKTFPVVQTVEIFGVVKVLEENLIVFPTM
jgi:hypothetical protein